MDRFTPRGKSRIVAERYALRKNRTYAYCKDHLYERRIANGEVQHWILVKDEESPNATTD